MAKVPTSYTEIVACWKPNMADLARDCSDNRVVLTRNYVHLWHHRDMIPPGWWNRVIAAAAKRGHPVDAEVLMNIAEARLTPNA